VKLIATMSNGEHGPCYIYARPGRVSHTVELSEGILADYDKKGRLCGIEIINGILPIICNGGKTGKRKRVGV